ncbi:MAG: threonylcarbamoyl-AMP synthase [Bacteriovoracaceae bacterium]|nr:threonylcarbamoyl-AMP synthase [Bacteriovoracaceae bacterium]
MIEYVFAHDPDDRIVAKACNLIREGHLIAAPTDTNWVFLADPFKKNAVDKLYQIKGVERDHHFSLLCSDFSMASELAHIPDSSFKLIRNKIPGHYTFIFEATKKVTKVLKASKTDHQIGLRFVPDVLINRLIKNLGGPLISTQIDANVLGRSPDKGPIYSYEVEEVLGSRLGMIIDPGEVDFIGPSTVYDLREDQMELIREGRGELLF